MAAVDEVVAAQRAEGVQLPGDLMRAVRVPASLRGEQIQDLMVRLPAPRVAELETEAFPRRLEGRSQPRRRGRERQAAGKKGGV
jgi:hypothetical protein